MKKGLLLPIVASTVLFAGGDIAPIEPVAEAPAASSSDFYGSATVGVSADINKTDANETRISAEYGVGVNLGVTKALPSGVLVNAEVQGKTTQKYLKEKSDSNGTRSPFKEMGGMTQANLLYSYGNTALKLGRFTIEGSTKKLSLLENTGTDYWGLKKNAYEGLMIVNTDIADTTVWLGYIFNTIDFTKGAKRERAGIIAGGLQNKSIEGLTVTLAGYYDENKTKDLDFMYKGAGAVDYTMGDTGITLGGAYVKYDDNNSYVGGGYVTQKFGMFDAKLGGAYAMGKARFAKISDIAGLVGTQNGEKVWGAGGSVSINTDYGKLKVGGSYSKGMDNNTTKMVATVGYSKNIMGIDFSTSYEFRKISTDDNPNHHVEAKAVYKF